MKKGAGRAESMQQDLGHMHLLGSPGEVLWGKQAKADLDSSKEKEWRCGMLCEGLI